MAQLGRWAPLLVFISACTEPNGALGTVLFTYDCSSSGPTPGSDAWCDTQADRSVLPVVAVGAPFTVASESDAPAAPAVAGLVQESELGSQWALVQPGWLGILAISGDSHVLDYTHIRGLNVGTITLSVIPSDNSSLTDFTFSTQRAGVIGWVVVTPRAEDGALLAGAIPCAFSSSSTSVVVDGTGRVGALTASVSGDATITATCLGQQAQVQLHVSIAPHEGSTDGSTATDAAIEARTDATTAAPSDGGTGADSEAGIGDALDSRSTADAEGG